MFIENEKMKRIEMEKCHDGEGLLHCQEVFSHINSEYGLGFMHDDILEPGASIGEHKHTGSEEVYYLIEGTGVMILDGNKFKMNPGDVSIVKSGHSHGFINSIDKPARLIVVEVSK